ncbi:MAG TPA: M14 metallopeptidase family protein, partial [Rhodothermales bacterium]|nr:M14 metallopeptidase family protein [Rhodothermales bacterium]
MTRFHFAVPCFMVLLLVLIGSGLCSLVQAQDRPDQTPLVSPRFAFSPEGSYDTAIPSPADFLGYEPGTQFTIYADVIAYIKALAEASDRVTLHEYGHTHEGRKLHYLVITTPENHGRIEDIRQNNLRFAHDQDVDVDGLIAQQPVITWLSYNVHGNEPSSTEAAMQVAYRLAAGQDDAVTDLLDDTVVIIDPAINPDGRDRYVYWYRSMQGTPLRIDPMDLEHDEPWPGGRTNHYWFDLNRDWVWLVHPESQGRIAAYQQWLPQVHVDYHEQGFNSNYFTMPGTTPRNLLLPDDYEQWSDTFGQGNIAAFDQHQISYATREAFDFYYPGYGSSYPSTMGAIGMLTEQGGHSRGGRAVETEDGYVLTLRQRIFDHYITSLAAIKTAVDN